MINTIGHGRKLLVASLHRLLNSARVIESLLPKAPVSEVLNQDRAEQLPFKIMKVVFYIEEPNYRVRLNPWNELPQCGEHHQRPVTSASEGHNFTEVWHETVRQGIALSDTCTFGVGVSYQYYFGKRFPISVRIAETKPISFEDAPLTQLIAVDHCRVGDCA